MASSPIGRRALELIHFSGELCDKPHYPDILDLPCGHGRVLRMLAAAFPAAWWVVGHRPSEH